MRKGQIRDGEGRGKAGKGEAVLRKVEKELDRLALLEKELDRLKLLDVHHDLEEREQKWIIGTWEGSPQGPPMSNRAQEKLQDLLGLAFL